MMGPPAGVTVVTAGRVQGISGSLRQGSLLKVLDALSTNGGHRGTWLTLILPPGRELRAVLRVAGPGRNAAASIVSGPAVTLTSRYESRMANRGKRKVTVFRSKRMPDEQHPKTGAARA